jgi:RNA polymerase sigma-70 factor (ECF subfamily)
MTAPNPAPAEPDDALVASWRAGNEEAATELVRRHAGPLARFLFSGGAPAGEIDDLVQETFFRAFRSVDRWRGDATFRSWLFRIGGNLRKDLYRRERGRVLVPVLEADLRDHADPEAEAMASESERQVRDGVGCLPRLQREVFLLRAQQGMEYTEIASAVGTTPGAARVHYHHAVRRLRELIR